MDVIIFHSYAALAHRSVFELLGDPGPDAFDAKETTLAKSSSSSYPPNDDRTDDASSPPARRRLAGLLPFTASSTCSLAADAGRRRKCDFRRPLDDLRADAGVSAAAASRAVGDASPASTSLVSSTVAAAPAPVPNDRASSSLRGDVDS